MPRAQRRTWIKLYCYGRLHGSVVYQLDDAEQSVWDKLLCLAGICGLDGLIADNDRRSYPHSFIAHEIHSSLELLESTLSKCIEEGRISENDHGIVITNWAAYQSEYDRQKPYRQATISKKARLEQQQEWGRLGLCDNCGEEGHDKWHCPKAKLQHLAKE